MTTRESTHSLSGAHLRIARPTNNIEALLPFYRDGLGFLALGDFRDHEGFDGVVLGLPGETPYHIEFTHKHGHEVGSAPSQDNLLIFYVPVGEAHTAHVERMKAAGFAPVKSFNPYWDRCGVTFQDPDGYRVVIVDRESPWVVTGG